MDQRFQGKRLCWMCGDQQGLNQLGNGNDIFHSLMIAPKTVT